MKATLICEDPDGVAQDPIPLLVSNHDAVAEWLSRDEVSSVIVELRDGSRWRYEREAE